MIHLDTLIRWVMTVAILASLTLAGWLAYENHTLIHTNAELARYVTGRLDSLDAELGRISGIDVSEALRVGGLVAVEALLRRTDK